jgi:fused signal recognition particle receptor
LPIKLVGVGEQIDDLQVFDPKTFVDALLGEQQVEQPGEQPEPA